MIVGSDERRYAFMDEGFNTFIDIYAADAFNEGEYAPKRDPVMPPPPAVILLMRSYLLSSIRKRNHYDCPRVTVIRKKYKCRTIEYFKPATGLVFAARANIRARPVTDYTLIKNYIHKWYFKHPQPDDFFRSMDNGGGRRIFIVLGRAGL